MTLAVPEILSMSWSALSVGIREWSTHAELDGSMEDVPIAKTDANFPRTSLRPAVSALAAVTYLGIEHM